MSKYPAAFTSAAAILALALAIPNSVNAGSSTSAPSKYKPNQTSQQQAKQNIPITEYSSSSRHTTPKQH